MDTTAIESVIAFFVPLLVAVIKKAGFPQTLNAAIAVVVYVVFGVLGVVVSGQPFDLNNIVPSVVIFTSIGTVAYQLFWKNWGDPQIVANVLP